MICRRRGVHDRHRLGEPTPHVRLVGARTTHEFRQREQRNLGAQRTLCILGLEVIHIGWQPATQARAPGCLAAVAIINDYPEIDDAVSQAHTAPTRTVEQHRAHRRAKTRVHGMHQHINFRRRRTLHFNLQHASK